nr:uncharacterized protein LOC128691923 [Cherax quadricarinatus]
MKTRVWCLCQVVLAVVTRAVPLAQHNTASPTRLEKTQYDKCSHSFHAWLCRPSLPVGAGRLPTVVFSSTTTRQPPPTHSQLPFTRPRPPTHQQSPPTRPTSPPITTPQHRKGSFLDAEPSLGGVFDSVPFSAPALHPFTFPLPTPPPQPTPPNPSLQSTPPTSPPQPTPLTPPLQPTPPTPPPQPTDPTPPQFIRTQVPHQGSVFFSDPLHAGRSFDSEASLGAPAPTLPPQTLQISSIPPSDKCSSPFQSWRCQKVTTPAPPPRNGDDNSPDASLRAGKDLLPEALPEPPPSKINDKCSHPFHSWLCQPAPRSRTIHRPLAQPSQLKHL